MFIKRWPTYALTVLLAGVLVSGAVIQRDAEAAVPGVRRLTVPAAAFTPAHDGVDYSNGGDYLRTYEHGSFKAHLVFPADAVRIHRITMRAYDNTPGDHVELYLYRAEPNTGDSTFMGYVYAPADIHGIQTVTTASISPKRVGSRQAAYLSVGLPANTTIYGVTVEWTPIDP